VSDRPKSALAKTPAERLEQLMELYAPMTEQPDGTFTRDSSLGVITKEQLLRLLDEVT
jgi:hypothetical protein